MTRPPSPKRCVAWVAFMLCALSTVARADTMTTEDIRQGYIKHAATARDDSPLANQLDILSEDVRLKSSLGEGQGHDDYIERVKNIPASWENAHFVENVDVEIDIDDTIHLEAVITYQNVGRFGESAAIGTRLAYNTRLRSTETVLPKFTAIHIIPAGKPSAMAYRDAYAENRLKSLVHHWLALIEDPQRNFEPFGEILADDFSLNFSSGAITDMGSFEEWFRGPASSVTASTHIISNFTYEDLGNDTYQVSMDFDWDGILPNDSQMTAKTRHKWIVVDDVSDRFARIKTVDVEVLEPFAPKE